MPEMRFLDVAGNELRTIVRDDAWLRFRVLFLGSLQNHFDISFSHGLTQIPMHEETTEPIQNAAQVIERAAQVDVRNVDMPVLMRSQRRPDENSYIIAGPAEQESAQTGGRWRFPHCGSAAFLGALFRQLTTARTALQAPEHFAGEFFYPMAISVLVDLVPVVLIENATNKHPVTIMLGNK
jgi:hypothetical protein